MEFIDLSTIVVAGKVTIAETAQYNKGQGCPLVDVRVCAVDHIGAKETFICTLTDAFGSFLSCPNPEQ